jgi:hypothetical protein
VDWQLVMAELLSQLTERGVQYCKTSGCLAIEFTDGCDALFADRKYADRHALTGSAGEIAHAILQRYDALDKARGQVLIGLRHHAKNSNVALERSSTGQWRVATADGCLSSMEVGPVLTRLVGELSPADALRKLLEHSILRTPSLVRAEKSCRPRRIAGRRIASGRL